MTWDGLMERCNDKNVQDGSSHFNVDNFNWVKTENAGEGMQWRERGTN